MLNFIKESCLKLLVICLLAILFLPERVLHKAIEELEKIQTERLPQALPFGQSRQNDAPAIPPKIIKGRLMPAQIRPPIIFDPDWE